MRTLTIVVIAVVTGVLAAAPRASAAPDPFADAEARYAAAFASIDTLRVESAELARMWRLSPTRTLAALRRHIDASGDLALTVIAMSAAAVPDPRLTDFLIAEYERASPVVQADLRRALAPYDHSDDHVEPFLRRLAGAQPPVADPDRLVARALDRIDRRRLAGLHDPAVLVAEVAKVDHVGLADQAYLQGLWVRLDGEVTEEGRFRTMVGGTRVEARFERDDEARAAFAPSPRDWVHLEGSLRTIHPAGDDHGKKVELELAYAALTPSSAPRVATTPAPSRGGCGCRTTGAGSSAPVLLGLLALLAWRPVTRRRRS